MAAPLPHTHGSTFSSVSDTVVQVIEGFYGVAVEDGRRPYLDAGLRGSSFPAFVPTRAFSG